MKALTRSGKQLVSIALACVGLTSLALQPVAAHAANLYPLTKPGGTTMYQSYRVLPTGAKVPGSGSTTSVLKSGGSDTLTAPYVIPGTIAGTAYRFLFWDIDGRLYMHRKAKFVAPSHQAAFAADAWYLLTGGGSCPGCPTYVTTYGFSLPEHKTLPGSPIASVVPSSAWTPPSASVSTTTAVTITAANPVEFVKWLAPGATATGTQLAVGAGVSTIAIAFYGLNPCQSILNQIESLSPGDFGPPNPAKEYQAAAHYLALQLRVCEAKHGG